MVSLRVREWVLACALVASPAGAQQTTIPTPTAPAVTVGADGLAVRSADGAFQLRLRGLIQMDGRFFFEDDERPVSDTLVLRRARPIVEGTLFDFVDFRFMPDFGGGVSVIQDAYLDLRFSPALRVRAGKAKVPVGLEVLFDDANVAFVERGLPSGLAPVRDVGLQVYGEPWRGKLIYAAGVFNGTPDASTGDFDANDAKEAAARIFLRPLHRPAGEAQPRLGLGLGVGASLGEQAGTPTAPGLASYRTAGQQVYFGYRSDGTPAGTTVADGERRRLAPQGWIHSGPWFALAEWTRSEQEVLRASDRADLSHVAWQIAVSWAATGEAVTERGLSPRRPFAPGGDGRGAVLLSLRYGRHTADRDAFPLFADPARSARGATNLGGSVSWLLTRGLKLVLDGQHTEFEGGASAGDREDENALLARIQLAF